MIEQIPKNKQLILFDGVCNLCNSSVLYVIKRDKKNTFLFAPLQSKTGQSIIKNFNIDTQAVDSVLLYQPKQNKVYAKSSAVLRIASHLNFPTKLLAIFFVIPRFIRDWVYNIVAKQRYNWFGKKATCMIPTPELSAKFLD